MSAIEARGVVRGRTVVLNQDAPDIPEGTEVFVVSPRRYATGAEIVAAIRALPPVSREDIEALQKAIDEGEQPMEDISPFAKLGGPTDPQ